MPVRYQIKNSKCSSRESRKIKIVKNMVYVTRIRRSDKSSSISGGPKALDAGPHLKALDKDGSPIFKDTDTQGPKLNMPYMHVLPISHKATHHRYA